MSGLISSAKPKLLFFVTEDYYFASHRLCLAVAAKNAGYDVTVVTRVRKDGETIRGAGIRLIPFENDRGGLNPVVDSAAFLRLVHLYRRERPDLVHHVAMKPVLYGSLAARLAGVPSVVNAVAGMGWLFTSEGRVRRRLMPIIRRALGRALQAGMVVVQNPDDGALVAGLGVRTSRIKRIPGSGVDLQQFQPSVPPGGTPAVVFPARLLWDKGVADFIAAGRILKERGIGARLLLAGTPDLVNPASVAMADIARWVDEGIVECLGWVADMPALLARSHIVCLPSYREGLPKSLIEAAAASRPIVTTDVPGCREVVRDGHSGFLVPPRRPDLLAAALERLLTDASLRDRMGACGRALAEREFGLDAVIGQTLAVYREALR
jgi:glycosyltransferase involved in cell wall biosynthesis